MLFASSNFFFVCSFALLFRGSFEGSAETKKSLLFRGFLAFILRKGLEGQGVVDILSLCSNIVVKN